MAFKPKPTKAKVAAVYKSIYIKEELVKEVEKIAKENNTSFNNVVISMIEECLKKINFYIKSWVCQEKCVSNQNIIYKIIKELNYNIYGICLETWDGHLTHF